MSLSDLPTELDNRTATFLIGDSPTLNALSKVSKYYHRIAQSHLYTHVVLKANDRHGLMCLCYAIITQKGVRHRIRAFSLEPFPEPPESYLAWAQKVKAVSSLWFVTSVEKAIHIYLQRHRIAAFYPSQRSPTYMLDTRPESGMVLAFILCTALNIEEIKLSNAVYNSRDQITEKVITRQWTCGIHFQKLRKLVMGYRGPALSATALPPSVTTFEHRRCRSYVPRIPTHRRIFWQAVLFRPLPTTLRRLVLTNVFDITPGIVGWAVQSCRLQNLEELLVHGCGEIDEQLEPDNFMRLLNSLAKFAPKQSSLRWTGQLGRPICVDGQWDQFKTLTQLRKLQLDLDMFTSLSVDMLLNLEHKCSLGPLPNPTNTPPGSLEDLTLDGLDIGRFRNFVIRLFRVIGRINHFENAFGAALAQLASKLPTLKRLAVSFDLVGHLPDPKREPLKLDPVDVYVLRLAADELFKVGLRLEVFSKPKFSEDPVRLLVKHGWTSEILGVE